MNSDNPAIGGIPGMIFTFLMMILNQLSVNSMLEAIILGLLGGVTGTLGHIIITWLIKQVKLMLFKKSPKEKPDETD